MVALNQLDGKHFRFRGRFSVTKKCRLHSAPAGHCDELAAKCIAKKLVTQEEAEREVNIIHSLQHPGIEILLDTFQTPDSWVLMFDMVWGGRLLDFILLQPSFDELQAAFFIHQLLDVLVYLHNCRIVHLDIKPENLLVEPDSFTGGVLKLIDFGDAVQLSGMGSSTSGSGLYHVHTVRGSPEFCAPELVTGAAVDLRSDVWSVGVVLYVLLSGVSPFLDESVEETCSNIIRRDFCFPDEYFAGVSDAAKDFIGALLVTSVR